MKKRQHTTQGWKQNGLILALAGTLLPLSFAGYALADDGTVKVNAITGIEVSLKVDTRLTKGLYMGDRWISSTQYTGTAGQDTVEARARGLDAKGTPVAISPAWIPSDSEMVTVSPSRGTQVTIGVKRPGESRLRVTSQDIAKELAIKAVQKGDVLQVEIAEIQTEAAADAAGTPAFKSEKEKINYALAMSLVSQLRRQGVELDADAYMQGFRDALSGGRTLLTEAEAQAIIAGLQNNLRSKSTSQAEKNKAAGEAFLEKNKSAEGVVTLASGLQYKILSEGSGPKPTLEDTVVCNYRGTLINGAEFDSSYKRNQPMTLALKKVISGWREALQLMPVGSKWQILIPSSLAYGSRQTGKIEPNSTLIFEVELLAIEGKS